MIRAENVDYIYPSGMSKGRKALNNVSLEIKDGTLNAIIGHTGSGKSTLIQLFNALILPSSGRVFVNGYDTSDKRTDLKKIRKTVGLVLQYPEHQLFEETVEKDIAFGPRNLGLSDTEIKKRVEYAAKLTGLSERHLKKSPFELSGGEKRRAAIAGVLAMSPEVLVLDEPAAGLDPMGREQILGIIKNLHREKPEMIIIFVSHSMEDVAKCAEYVYVMNCGTLEMSGTAAEVFSHGERLQAMGLDIPEIARLTNAIRDLGYDIPNDIYTLEAAKEEIEKLICMTS